MSVMEDYAPRSPDLSGLNTQPSQGDSQIPRSYAYPPLPPSRTDSFSIGSSSYYQPPPLLNQDSSTLYSQSSYEPRITKLESQPSWQPEQTQAPKARRPGRPKREDTSQSQDDFATQGEGAPQTPVGKVRKQSVKSKKAALADLEPRPPAPGDAEGIVIKTKFPAARIKRIVQADEEVGKVAQATPVAVGKALELFLIQMSLASIEEIKAQGSKRLLAQHVKAAITKSETFDFLKDIGDKIADGPTKAEGRGRIPKMERIERGTSDDDDEMDEDEAPKKTGRRKKRRSADED